MDQIYLSKTDFLNYRLCPSYCWVHKHRADLVPEENDPSRKRLLLFGNQIDVLARARYPNGELTELLDGPAAAQQSAALASRRDVDVIYQATVLTTSGLQARADILVRDAGGWRLIEVKNANSAKDEHYDDATFQLVAFEAAGFTISRVSLLHLNKEYRRAGVVDVATFFVEDDSTVEVNKRKPELTQSMGEALDLLRTDRLPTTCPCKLKTRSHHCPTFDHFHPDLRKPGSVYELQRLHATKLLLAAERGIFSLRDWPDDIGLTPGQRNQLHAHRTREAHVDRDGLRALLGKCEFPLYFLDYETSAVPIPMFDGCGPHQQVPFQFSLHIVRSDGEQLHREFLATERGANPMSSLVHQLQAEIGEKGTVVAWHASFERAVNKELATYVVEEAEFLLNLNERMLDLEDAVSKQHYVHPDFHGSSSIKVVLPVAAPDLDYESLEIQNGETASERWLACMVDDVSDIERELAFDALREYCRLDTLAMVRIWQHLAELCKDRPDPLPS